MQNATPPPTWVDETYQGVLLRDYNFMKIMREIHICLDDTHE